MINTTPSTLRENKAATIKVSILQSTLELIGQKSFDKLHVNQICDAVGVSKVTFFKYFPQKEDILLYYLRVWCFQRCVELSADPRKGVEGIRYLFEKICVSYERTPGIFLGLVSYLNRSDMPIRPFTLRKAERKLFYPDVDDILIIDTLSLDQLFENFLLEAIFAKEITRTSNTRQLVQLMNTILYGSIMTAHVQQVEYPSILFKRNVNAMLEALQTGEMSFAGIVD